MSSSVTQVTPFAMSVPLTGPQMAKGTSVLGPRGIRVIALVG